MAKSYEKTIVDGHSFDSTTEAEFYGKLKLAVKEGRIKDFEMEPEYVLMDEFVDWRGKKYPAMKHLPDYLVTLNDGSKMIVDTKGGTGINHETDAKIKRKMWMKQNPDIPYYYVSENPKYLGGVWVETSTYFDFGQKLKSKYNKLYPKVNKRLKTAPKLNVGDWDRWFEYENIAGLFYVWKKTFTKRELEKMSK